MAAQFGNRERDKSVVQELHRTAKAAPVLAAIVDQPWRTSPLIGQSLFETAIRRRG